MAILITATLVPLFVAAGPAAQGGDPAPGDWGRRVAAARALDDPAARGDAMLVLVREALGEARGGTTVELSGATRGGEVHPDEVHPDDNRPAPIVNFDPRLNEKRSFRFRPGGRTHSLRDNFGYHFTRRGVSYIVLGPAALDRRGPVFTRMAADHEIYHAAHHVHDERSGDDQELETWTQMFVRYFHEVYRFDQRWAPMMDYYADASRRERRAALDRLAAYYRSPPVTGDPAGAAAVRAGFDRWLAWWRDQPDRPRLADDLARAISAPPL